MNKILLFAISSILLVGCSANKQDDGSTTIALVKDNFNTYFNYSCNGPQVSYGVDIYFNVKGVLSFAVYQDVVLTLNMHVFADGDSYSYKKMDNNFERKITLNAAGEGSSVLYASDGKIDHVVDTTIGSGTLLHYQCTWSLKDITGSVKYRI